MKKSPFEDYAEQIGAGIQRLRKAKDLTQEDVAYGAEVSIRHYQQLESGRMNPTLHTLFRVASVLKMPLHKVLEAAVAGSSRRRPLKND